MELATLLPILLKTSIALSVFCLGLEASIGDAVYLIRRPGLLFRSLLSTNVVAPLLATTLALVFDLRPAVEIALLALAVSPVPPKMPEKTQKVAGGASYAIGLLVALSLLSILWIPLAIKVLGEVFGFPIHMGPMPLLSLVFTTILGPLLLGMLVARYVPMFGARTVRLLSIVATVLLVAAIVPILFTSWNAILSLLGNGTVASIVGFILIALAAGHFIGGPSDNNRAVLAISSAFRHPGIAMTIAASTFPDQKLAPAALTLYLLLGAIISQLYTRWMAHRHTQSAATTAATRAP
ncbi:MAG: bile acid:sodium symporter family protein [Vulcanimicrobiaceae bacterium]